MPDALMTRAQFSRMARTATLETIHAWHPPLIEQFRVSEIVTDRRQAANMASGLNETGGFTVFDEVQGSYFNTPWSRIAEIFGGVIGLTAELVRSWKALGREAFDVAFFNHVYADANRPPGYRLGNTQPGDGYRFRGMGPNALTGRGNYVWMEKETGIPLVADPEIIKTPEAGSRIMCHFWRKHGLNEAVDDGSLAGFLYAMRRMNAGLQDFSHHVAFWALTTAVMADDDISERDYPVPLPIGKKKADIVDMQSRLVGKGYDTNGIDGIVGPGTTGAIKGFETAVGLENDGLVDPDMLAALRHRFLGLRRGGKDKPTVIALQNALIKAGQDLGPWGADGDFGGYTETALGNLQSFIGLRRTGYVDHATLGRLKLAA